MDTRLSNAYMQLLALHELAAMEAAGHSKPTEADPPTVEIVRESNDTDSARATFVRLDPPMIAHQKPMYTTLDVEQLQKLIDHLYHEEVPNPKERKQILWQFVAEQLDRLGIVVENYYRRSVYGTYAEELMANILQRDTVIANNINHIPGGSIVRLRVFPTHVIIERLQ